MPSISRPWGAVLYLALFAILLAIFFNRQFHGYALSIISLLFGTALSVLLLYLVTVLFGTLDFKKGFFNFLIGDEGGYSLSRLQAVLWAIIIIGEQLAVILCLLKNKATGSFSQYELSFSESTLWLLALSLTSSIAVKGIVVDKINKRPSLYKRKRPSWSQIVNGSNGLDFSKCQMFIWTIIGIFVFWTKCIFFLNSLALATVNSTLAAVNEQKQKTIAELFQNHYAEASTQQEGPFLPYLPWSFVVLMGLSQGVYVGKKLIPSFKLDDIKAEKQGELLFQQSQFRLKQSLLFKMVNMAAPQQLSEIDKKNQEILSEEIKRTESAISELRGDIREIDEYKKGVSE